MDNCSDLRISNCSAATLDLWLLTFVILTSVIVSLHYCLLKGTVCKIPLLDVIILEIAVNLIRVFYPSQFKYIILAMVATVGQTGRL